MEEMERGKAVTAIQSWWTGNKIPCGYEEIDLYWNTEKFLQETIIPNYYPNEDKTGKLTVFAPVEKGEIFYHKAYWGFHPKESGDLDLELSIFMFTEPSEIMAQDRESYGYGEIIGITGIAPTTLKKWLKDIEESLRSM